MTKVDMLPLAITLESDVEACVAGVDGSGAWIRPSPIPPRLVSGPDPAFAYRRRALLAVGAAPPPARPEDRSLLSAPRRGALVEEADHDRLLGAVADAGVEGGFEGGRSAALIAAEVRDIYARRHTRGRSFLRIVFTDATGDTFDWLCPELRTVQSLAPFISDGALDPAARRSWLDAHASARLFLAIGLTFPTRTYESRFGGCHPLVVGIHRPGTPCP
jgi:hypothetical protein